MAYNNVTITTDINLSFIAGQFVQLLHDSSNYIHGKIVSYDSTNGLLTITPTSFSGYGNYSNWKVIISGAPGVSGTSGMNGSSGMSGSSGVSGSSGTSVLASFSWAELVTGFKTSPVELTPIATGDVYSYTFAGVSGDVTYYRFIATDGSNDSFYVNFDGSVFSGLIASKKLIIV